MKISNEDLQIYLDYLDAYNRGESIPHSIEYFFVRICARYAEGKSTEEISKDLLIPIDVISSILKKNGQMKD